MSRHLVSSSINNLLLYIFINCVCLLKTFLPVTHDSCINSVRTVPVPQGYSFRRVQILKFCLILNGSTSPRTSVPLRLSLSRTRFPDSVLSRPLQVLSCSWVPPFPDLISLHSSPISIYPGLSLRSPDTSVSKLSNHTRCLKIPLCVLRMWDVRGEKLILVHPGPLQYLLVRTSTLYDLPFSQRLPSTVTKLVLFLKRNQKKFHSPS